MVDSACRVALRAELCICHIGSARVGSLTPSMIHAIERLQMPFFKLDEMPGAVVAPGHSTAHGPTITGKELEIGYYTEPKNTGAKPHHHKSEQIILVLS